MTGNGTIAQFKAVLNNVRAPNKRTIAAHGPAHNTPPDCHQVQQLIAHQADDAESRSILEGGNVGWTCYFEFDGFGVVVDGYIKGHTTFMDFGKSAHQ